MTTGTCSVLLFEMREDEFAAHRALSPIDSEHTYALMAGPAAGSLGAVGIAEGVFAP